MCTFLNSRFVPQECFRMLHGDVEKAKDKGIEIIGILEELELETFM